MTRSLYAKMVMILLLLTLSTMLIVGVVLISNVSSFYQDSFVDQMDVAIDDDMITMLAEVSPGDGAAAAMNERLTVYASELGVNTYRNYYILSAEGEYLAGTNPELGGELSLTPNILTAMTGERGDHISNANRFMDYAVPMTLEDGSGYILYICDTKEQIRDLTWVMLTIIIEALFVGMILAVLLSFVLVRTITSPIEKITKGAIQIAEGDLHYRIDVAGSDEIGTLTENFNSMAEALEHSISSMDREREKLSALFLHLSDGVAAFDSNGVLLHFNPAAERMLSARPTEGLARFEELMVTVCPDLRFEDLRSGKETTTRTVEAELEGKFLNLQLAPFGEGETRGVLVVIHDVTQQRRLDASRKEFIANVSHELRTPLTNVKSYTETVADTPDLTQEERKSFLQVVINETDRMIRIVKDLLQLSKLDSGKMDLHFSRFALRPLLERVWQAERIEAENHQHTLTLQVDDSVGELEGDSERIEQVLVNVVSNAIKYTPDGGRILVEAMVDSVNAYVKVTDNGIGIPAKDLPRLFDRFYRVDKARSREKGGTGLGLAIAKEIVEAHRGTITVRSEVGQFTEMLVTLPLQLK